MASDAPEALALYWQAIATSAESGSDVADFARSGIPRLGEKPSSPSSLQSGGKPARYVALSTVSRIPRCPCELGIREGATQDILQLLVKPVSCRITTASSFPFANAAEVTLVSLKRTELRIDLGDLVGNQLAQLVVNGQCPISTLSKLHSTTEFDPRPPVNLL